jgi:hypothetical protein
MTRVLVFGYAPLPFEPYRLSGPNLRTWHFVSVLRAAGHQVCLICDRMAGVYPEDSPTIITTEEENFIYHCLHSVRLARSERSAAVSQSFCA